MVGKGLSQLLYYLEKCFNSRFPGQGMTAQATVGRDPGCSRQQRSVGSSCTQGARMLPGIPSLGRPCTPKSARARACTHTLRRKPEPSPCLSALEMQRFGFNKAAIFSVAADAAGCVRTPAGTTLPGPSTAPAGC